MLRVLDVHRDAHNEHVRAGLARVVRPRSSGVVPVLDGDAEPEVLRAVGYALARQPTALACDHGYNAHDSEASLSCAGERIRWARYRLSEADLRGRPTR